MENTEKFTGKADVYAKYRPGYPAELFEHLYQKYSLNASSVVADIGSGTGIFTRELLKSGMKVKAVEPNADMRLMAEKQLNSCPNFESVNGSAEHTTLSDGSIDLVTAAQAFHWFDPCLFRKECTRILKKDRFVVLVWNHRVDSAPLMEENAEVCRKFCADFHGFSGSRTRDPAPFRAFFRSGRYEELAFPHDLPLDLDAFVGRNLSASYAPQRGSERYSLFIEALAELFGKYERGGRVLMPNITRSYAGQV